MPKAKTGDQRFKKKSHLPYIIAALSLLFVVGASFFAVSSIFRPKNLYPFAQRRYVLSPVEYVITAEYLWEYPVDRPYIVFSPDERKIAQDGEICFELKVESASTPPAPVHVFIDIDEMRTTNLTMEWNRPYCFQPYFEKGYHLIQLRTALFIDQWGILVE